MIATGRMLVLATRIKRWIVAMDRGTMVAHGPLDAEKLWTSG